MKKTRILAVLLCVMMIVTVLPGLQLTAAAATYDTVSDVMGKEMVVAEGLDYQFSSSYTPGEEVKHYIADGYPGQVSYTDNGMSFSADNTIWYIAPSENPFAVGTATVIKAKIGSASEYFNIQNNQPGGGRTYIDVYQDKVVATAGKRYDGDAIITTDNNVTTSFDIGSDWFELMIVPGAEGYRIYAKNAGTDNKWTLVVDIMGYRSGGTFGKLSFSTAGASSVLVKSIQVYREKPAEDLTIEGILGVDQVSCDYEHQFTASYHHAEAIIHNDAGNNYGTTTYTDDGLALPTDKTAIWYLTRSDGQSYWNTENATVVKAKLGTTTDNFEFHIMSPNYDNHRVYVNIKANQINAAGANPETDTDLGKGAAFDFGTDWFEVLVHSRTDGHDIYVRNERNGQKWEKVLEFYGYRKGTPALGNFCIAGVSKDADKPVLIKSVSLYKEYIPGTGGGEGGDGEGEGGDGEGEGGGDTPGGDTGEELTIEGILGLDEVSCEGYDHQFDASYSHADAGHYTNMEGRVSYTADGMSFPVGKDTLWRLFPAESPWLGVNGTVVRAKFGSSNESLSIQNHGTAGTGRTYITISSGEVRATPGTGATQAIPYQFGTDWFDLLIANKADGYALYIRNGATNNKWTKVLELEGYYTGTVATGKFCLSANAKTSVLVKSISVYKDPAFYNGGDSDDGGNEGDATGTYYDSVDDVMGKQMQVSKDYQFGASYVPGDDIGHVDASGFPGRVSYTENGASFPAGQGTIWYLKPDNTFLMNTATVLKMKLATTDDAVTIQMNKPGANAGRTYIEVKTNGLTSTAGMRDDGSGNLVAGDNNQSVSFNFGTDWFELMVVPHSEGYKIYAKNGTTGNKWQLVQQIAGYRSGRTSGGLSLSTTAVSGIFVKSIQVYNDPNAAEEEEIPTGAEFVDADANLVDILGPDVAATTKMRFSESFIEPDGITFPDGAIYTDINGLDLTGANGGVWRYMPSASYTPFSKKAFRITAKMPEGGSLGVYAMRSTLSGRLYVDATPSSFRTYTNNGTSDIPATNLFSFAPGTEWVDYLFFENELGGFSIYVKSATNDTDQWKKLVETDAWRTNQDAGLRINGKAYIKCIKIYGDKSEVSYDAIGGTFTLEQIVNGVATTKEELIFDSNFSGAEHDAVAKNYKTNEELSSQYTIGANGLVLASTGADEAFAWRSGTRNKWKPLSSANPIMFRAKVTSGAKLEVRANGNPQAGLTIMTDRMVLSGAVETVSEFVPGTDWVNYLITSDGNNYQIYTKTDSETLWTLRAVSDGFKSGGYYGLLMMNTTSAPAYVSRVEQLKIRKVILTDSAAMEAECGKVYLNEYFTFANDKWTLDGLNVINGTLMGSGTAIYDLSDITTGGNWYFRTRVKITGANGVSGVIRNDKKKIEWKFKSDGLTVGATRNPISVSMNQWYDLTFAFKASGTVDVYCQAVGEDSAKKTHADMTVTEERGDDMSFTITDGSVDDVKIYENAFFGVDSMNITNGSYTIKGDFITGTISSEFDRRGTLLITAFDKQNGYTSYISEIEYPEITSGVGVDLSQTLENTGLVAEENDLAVMMWDALETGVALGDVVGAKRANTATGEPVKGQTPELTITEKFNEVGISGYTGVKNGRVTASLVDENGVLCSAVQSVATEKGMVSINLAVAPETASGTYTLRVKYQGGEVVEKTVTLYGSNIPYNSINSVSDMRNFIASYGSESAKAWNTEESFAADVYSRYLDGKGNTASFTDFYGFRNVMDRAMDDEVYERELCGAVNNAVKNGNWTVVRDTLLASDLGIIEADFSFISNPKALFLRMGSNYTEKAVILSDFRAAVAAQKAVESAAPGEIGGGAAGGAGGGGGAAGGGFGGGGTAANIETNAIPESNVPAEIAPMQKFNDLDSVEWARESIEKLQKRGVISGDGDGEFYPDRAVTREEFLKMAMQTAGIKVEGSGEVAFADVDANAWYYSYVATAYQAGIVTGMSEEYFGIGQQITRSDMAVMLKRILDYKNTSVDAIRPAVVFDDFNTIPEYARKSVLNLYEAGLMNGMGENLFAGSASATRAEAATAIYRIYQYMDERR